MSITKGSVGEKRKGVSVVKNIGRCWKKESETEEEREKESETVGESE